MNRVTDFETTEALKSYLFIARVLITPLYIALCPIFIVKRFFEGVS